MADLTSINTNLAGKLGGWFKAGSLVKVLSFFFLGVIILGGVGWYAWYRIDKKVYNKKIKAFPIINGFFSTNDNDVYRDTAKSVKLGKGGFEILYLKKLKTWKLAHYARSGSNEYTFFMTPEGYWFPAHIEANLYQIHKDGGVSRVVTTNPMMRSQYTALEKQIDDMHGDKKSFWDKYGTWILSIGFVMVIGLFAWLIFREMSPITNNLAVLTEKTGTLVDRVNVLLANTGQQNNGAIPV